MTVKKIYLPAEFTDLQELADKFAVSDDLERELAVARATHDDRRRFVDTLWPRMDAINQHLDHHDDEPDHLLGRLAEAAVEISLEIGLPSHEHKKPEQ